MDILIEGWRKINHSYSLVNQWQINELLSSCNIFFKDIPFLTKDWNIKKNDSGFDDNLKNIINNLKPPGDNQNFDITYRISSPYNFDNDFKSKLLFVFGTCEYKRLNKEVYINGSPEFLKYEENFYIHTPSRWSRDGFLKAGFREDQIIVIPHGIETNTFNFISEDEKKIIREKYKIKADDFVLTNVGAMTQNKGIECLVAAYGILKKKIQKS